MRRLPSAAREGWRATVESQGLVYAMTDLPGGGQVPYWCETACYALELAEVEHLEAAVAELHAMCEQVVHHVLARPERLADFGLDPAWAPYLRSTLDAPSVYGRFDLAFTGLSAGPAKLLEYNADTPTGLVESSVVQWFWLEDVHPELDQWNSLHDRLGQAWAALRPRLPGGPVHFAHSEQDSSGEEWMTTAYMRDVAAGAGLSTLGLTVESIGWDSLARRFVGLEREPLTTVFKLYPWEDMMSDRFGPQVREAAGRTAWVEPAWKALLSNKALLALLWELYPGHPHLLPAFLDGPHGMTRYAAKPLHGREGDGIRLVDGERVHEQPAVHYGGPDDAYVYQELYDLPRLDGAHPVLGCWVVAGEPAGLGIRESDNPVTDYYARFVPHYVEAPRPDPETVQEWLRE